MKVEHFSNMELFRKHPSLCSLFLLALEDWGASRVDWNLLNDEEFADLLSGFRGDVGVRGGDLLFEEDREDIEIAGATGEAAEIVETGVEGFPELAR